MNNPFAQPPQGQPGQPAGNPFAQPPQAAPQPPMQAPPQQPPGNPFGGSQGQPQPQQGQQPAAPPQGQSSGKSLDDALAGGKAPSAFSKTDPVGTVRQGTIINHDIRQMRDPKNGQGKFWSDGNPQEQIVIRIQTNMRENPEDDGVRGIYVKMWGPNLDNLKEAIRQTGAEKPTQAIVPGAVLSAQFAEERSSDLGNPEKIFNYHIQLPQPGQDVQFQQQPNQAMQVAQNNGWTGQPEQPPY